MSKIPCPIQTIEDKGYIIDTRVNTPFTLSAGNNKVAESATILPAGIYIICIETYYLYSAMTENSWYRVCESTNYENTIWNTKLGANESGAVLKNGEFYWETDGTKPLSCWVYLEGGTQKTMAGKQVIIKALKLA